MTSKKNVRESALDILETINNNQAYSNLLLNNAIKKNEIPAKDVGLLTELVYGTLQRKMTLAYYLQPFLKNSKKMQSWVVTLLQLTLYQIVYLDRIPDHAAIHEAVEIAKKRGHKGISGLVNAVLRNIQRQGLPKTESIEDSIERIAVETSHPNWLVKRWAEQFGLEETQKMCQLNLTPPIQTARINTTKTTVEECIRLLEAEGYNVKTSEIIPEGVHCLKGNLANSRCFQDGLLTIQDESSMLVAYALNVKEPLSVLDACAAPGGKSTHIGEKMGNKGNILSVDLHEHKVKLIRQNAERLHLDNIETKAMDAKKLADIVEANSFDRILIDAPCSGLGVMRRKPDIKYTKDEKDMDRLQTIQLKLLEEVSPLLKKGGLLIYSTCTVDRKENEEVVASFLAQHQEFTKDTTLASRLPESVQSFAEGYQLQILPQHFGSDGFYIAALKKEV
ncbi:16S rRNA (cytosine(967)-C(5))-methyltransferase RsmB [Niallia sp. NCCP-28]|uniref:16S rRNA (cytosine(967)-C(5))-methyltransferase RsmB n=1 Tax=Niallia sp. NCCP-28 TaxID=2934712 RepID=UPI00208564A6|nr:16S rRNA (cytosine(967)-C(5))-methyltransferase RsmB [Niallia sp. NCCP-28]GKU82423.1 ribosomal RNA small subunit methyltransferase B [Niallia sp. NCCP-28]